MPRVIITVQDKNPQPYRFQLDRKVVSLGRGSDNDIVIDSGSVSAKHAEMRRIEGGYELADLGSTNGIKHNGIRHATAIPLHSGIAIYLGEVAFDFTLTDEELELLGREKPIGDAPVMAEVESAQPLNTSPEPPVREAIKPAVSTPPTATVTKGGNFMMILLFLLLAAAAFYAGLAIRHQKDTGESLLKGIVNKSDAVEAEPAAAPRADPVAE